MKTILVGILLMCLAAAYGQAVPGQTMPGGGATPPPGTGQQYQGYPAQLLPFMSAVYDVDFQNLLLAEYLSQSLGGSPWARHFAGNMYDMPDYYWLGSAAFTGK